MRLTRAVYVVTAEHLGWYIVAGYALITRTIALGARPLDAAQATDALTALLIAQHGRAAFALSDTSWVTILQGWIFAAIGASDATSRIVVTLCGLLLIATGFALRPVLGRAGALAFAALIAISPSVAYFSLGGSTVIASHGVHDDCDRNRGEYAPAADRSACGRVGRRDRAVAHGRSDRLRDGVGDGRIADFGRRGRHCSD